MYLQYDSVASKHFCIADLNKVAVENVLTVKKG